ncbi:MAG TPA: hypothetical protein PLF13_13615 [candidate division Zixibacteria bacterium]|nr:hypothetical protein [candidate division Zixibacteria bacterium]
MTTTSPVILLLTLTALAVHAQQPDFQHLTGPYLGQTPPGTTPQVFAEGLIDPDLHGCPVFTPDGLEVYWKPMNNEHVLCSRTVDGHWTAPTPIEFPHRFDNSDAPILSVDGIRLYFVSTEPMNIADNIREHVWFSDRNENGWGTPTPAGNNINRMGVHWQTSVAANGDLYFHSLNSGGGDIFSSSFIDDAWAVPEALGATVNAATYEHAPFIAPDQSYLIFSRVDFSSEDKGADLFISFRKPNGEWGLARPMTELNKPGINETAPNVTRDGKYLFFLSNTANGLSAHWVSTAVIDRYRS